MSSRIMLIICLLYGCPAMGQTIVFSLSGVPDSSKSMVGIRGNIAPLSWEKTIPLSPSEEGYEISLQLNPADEETLEFKFVLVPTSKGAPILWERTPNRKMALSQLRDTIYQAVFDQEPYIDPNSFPLLSTEALSRDLAIVEMLVKKIHPGTYRYQDSGTVATTFRNARKQFSSPQTNVAAFLAFSKIVASVQCDHTRVIPPYLHSVRSLQHDKLPYTFRWIAQRMVVTGDATQANHFPVGTEILSVNGQSAVEIYQELYPLIPADGPAAEPRAAKLSVNGYTYELGGFDLWFYLLHPIPEAGHCITYRTKAGRESQIITVAGLSLEVRDRILRKKYPNTPNSANDLWNLEVLDDSTAVLEIGSFAVGGPKGLKLNVNDFFAEAFAAISAMNIRHLIIDVRENTGGSDPIVVELLTYFPFNYRKVTGFVGRKRYLNMPDELTALIARKFGQGIETETGGEYDPVNDSYVFPNAFLNFQENMVKPNAFAGKVYWLTGRQNASLGFYLAKAVRDYELGLLIGETTAGSQQGINGGASFSLRLPNSGIQILMPVMGSFTTGAKPNVGIVPDFEVAPTIESIRSGEDLALLKALSIIRTH